MLVCDGPMEGFEWGLNGGGGEGGMGERKGEVPCLSDDYVVEGGIAFAEAGETDFNDHGWGVRMEGGWRGGEDLGLRFGRLIGLKVPRFCAKTVCIFFLYDGIV